MLWAAGQRCELERSPALACKTYTGIGMPICCPSIASVAKALSDSRNTTCLRPIRCATAAAGTRLPPSLVLGKANLTATMRGSHMSPTLDVAFQVGHRQCFPGTWASSWLRDVVLPWTKGGQRDCYARAAECL